MSTAVCKIYEKFTNKDSFFTESGNIKKESLFVNFSLILQTAVDMLHMSQKNETLTS
jgi:hypothetical protein